MMAVARPFLPRMVRRRTLQQLRPSAAADSRDYLSRAGMMIHKIK